MKVNYGEVVERLIEYRKENKLSKVEMARRLGIDRSLYSRIESRTRTITYDILWSIVNKVDTIFKEKSENSCLGLSPV